MSDLYSFHSYLSVHYNKFHQIHSTPSLLGYYPFHYSSFYWSKSFFDPAYCNILLFSSIFKKFHSKLESVHSSLHSTIYRILEKIRTILQFYPGSTGLFLLENPRIQTLSEKFNLGHCSKLYLHSLVLTNFIFRFFVQLLDLSFTFDNFIFYFQLIYLIIFLFLKGLKWFDPFYLIKLANLTRNSTFIYFNGLM